MNKQDIIYGIHAVQEAVSLGRSLNKVYIQKDVQNERLREIIQKLRREGIPFQLVPREKLNRLTMKAHQGIVALTAEVEFYTIADVLPQVFEEGEAPLIAILDGVTDVRNVGAIARSAECFGIHALVVPAQGSAPINADAMKSSAGALNRVRVCREINFKAALDHIKGSGLQLVACTEKAAQGIGEVDFTLPTAIVLGAEGEGINESLLQQCDVMARIPIVGEIQSLNVSVAAGIVFYTAILGRG